MQEMTTWTLSVNTVPVNTAPNLSPHGGRASLRYFWSSPNFPRYSKVLASLSMPLLCLASSRTAENSGHSWPWAFMVNPVTDAYTVQCLRCGQELTLPKREELQLRYIKTLVCEDVYSSVQNERECISNNLGVLQPRTESHGVNYTLTFLLL